MQSPPPQKKEPSQKVVTSWTWKTNQLIKQNSQQTGERNQINITQQKMLFPPTWMKSCFFVVTKSPCSHPWKCMDESLAVLAFTMWMFLAKVMKGNELVHGDPFLWSCMLPCKQNSMNLYESIKRGGWFCWMLYIAQLHQQNVKTSKISQDVIASYHGKFSASNFESFHICFISFIIFHHMFTSSPFHQYFTIFFYISPVFHHLFPKNISPKKKSPHMFICILNSSLQKNFPPIKTTWKAKCPIFKAIVAGFRGKVALKNRILGVPGSRKFDGSRCKDCDWSMYFPRSAAKSKTRRCLISQTVL